MTGTAVRVARVVYVHRGPTKQKTRRELWHTGRKQPNVSTYFYVRRWADGRHEMKDEMKGDRRTGTIGL